MHDHRRDRSSTSERKRSYPNDRISSRISIRISIRISPGREETRSYRQTVFPISLLFLAPLQSFTRYATVYDQRNELDKRSRDSRRIVNNRAEDGSPTKVEEQPSNALKHLERNAFYSRHEARNNPCPISRWRIICETVLGNSDRTRLGQVEYHRIMRLSIAIETSRRHCVNERYVPTVVCISNRINIRSIV